MQAAAFLLKAAGLGDGFLFHYANPCPFCRPLDRLAYSSYLLGDLSVEKCEAVWGGTYWIYRVDNKPGENVHPARIELAALAVKSDAIVLAVASSAVYLKLEGWHDDIWKEILHGADDPRGSTRPEWRPGQGWTSRKSSADSVRRSTR